MLDENLDGLYPRLLGAAWARVHPAVRALHLTGERKVVTGTLVVEEGRHWLARRRFTMFGWGQLGWRCSFNPALGR